MIETKNREEIENIVSFLRVIRRRTITISPEAALKIKEAMEILTKEEAKEIIFECIK